MLAVAYGALRARRSQSLLLALVALLLAAGAAAAPVVALAASDQVRRHDLAAAPADQRYLDISNQIELDQGGTPLDTFADQLRRLLPLPHFERYTGLRIDGDVLFDPNSDNGSVGSRLAARDGACERAAVTGACPRGPGEAMLPEKLAAQTGLRVGEAFQFYAEGLDTPLSLTVVGTFRPVDPTGPYWSAPTSEAGGSAGPLGDAVLMDLAALVATRPVDATASVVLIATPDGMKDPHAVAATVTTVLGGLRGGGSAYYANVGALADRLSADQDVVRLWIPLVAVEFVALGWYAVFFAVGAAGAAKGSEVGLVKLRGVPRPRLWLFVAGRSWLPILGGTVAGAALGMVAAALVVGGPGRLPDPGLALLLLAGCVLVGLLGALLAAVLAERRSVRAPVVDLLRQVPARRRGWRTDVADLVLVVAAGVGVWQARVAATGFAALATELLCLAAALVVARGLVPVAARVGAAGLRTGRPRAALAALHLARRPGLDRIFALLVVSVALTGYAVGSSLAVAADRDQRARVSAGAAKVLTVRAANRRVLLDAVRAVDPAGRYAMAATRTSTKVGEPTVLAVDASRLAAVALWPAGAPLSAAQVAALLRPSGPVDPVQLIGAQLSLTVTAPATWPTPIVDPSADPDADPAAEPAAEPAEGAPASVVVEAQLVGPDGVGLAVQFGPLRPGRQDYQVTAPACADQPGCRLTGFVLGELGPIGLFGNPLPGTAGDAVVLHQLSAGGVVAVSQAQFADRSRWRPTVDPAYAGAVLASAPDGLALSSPGQVSSPVSPTLYPVDTPVPLPIVTSRPLDVPDRAGDPRLDPFGVDTLPVAVAGTLPVLPGIGGGGALVDLDSADRLAVASGDPSSADLLQVWLAAGAPARIVDQLRAHGVSVLRVDTLGAIRHQLDTDAGAVAVTCQLVGALLTLALAGCAVLLVAAVERPAWTAELRALRLQGMSAGAARTVARGGYAVLAGTALLLGLAIAVFARLLLGDPLLGGDLGGGTDPGVHPGRLLLGGLVALAVLGPAAFLAGARLAASVPAGPGDAPTGSGPPNNPASGGPDNSAVAGGTR